MYGQYNDDKELMMITVMIMIIILIMVHRIYDSILVKLHRWSCLRISVFNPEVGWENIPTFDVRGGGHTWYQEVNKDAPHVWLLQAEGNCVKVGLPGAPCLLVPEQNIQNTTQVVRVVPLLERDHILYEPGGKITGVVHVLTVLVRGTPVVDQGGCNAPSENSFGPASLGDPTHIHTPGFLFCLSVWRFQRTCLFRGPWRPLPFKKFWVRPWTFFIYSFHCSVYNL